MLMKKFLLLLVLLCGAVGIGRAQAPTGTIQSTKADDIVSVTLALSNPEGFAACAFQCDVELPEGLVGLEEGANVPVLNNAPDHVIASHYITAEKKYRILCYSMSNAALPENASVTFKVQCNKAGTFDYTLSGIELANADSESRKDIGIMIEDSQGEDIPGDLNNDSKVDALDLSLLIDYILEKDLSGDISKDGKVDAIDHSLLIEKILNK